MEQITQDLLPLNQLPFECYEVIQLYIISANENEAKIAKIQPKTYKAYGVVVKLDHAATK